MLESVGRFDGRAEASAGTIVAALRLTLRGLLLILLLGGVGGGFSGGFSDDAGAFEGEAERLAGLGFFGDFNVAVALIRILDGLESSADLRP